MSEESDDFFEYTRGKKIPPEGIPGFDFSDPESIVEFTKYVVCEWCDWDGGLKAVAGCKVRILKWSAIFPILHE